jgi:hypothetical protein
MLITGSRQRFRRRTSGHPRLVDDPTDSHNSHLGVVVDRGGGGHPVVVQREGAAAQFRRGCLPVADDGCGPADLRVHFTRCVCPRRAPREPRARGPAPRSRDLRGRKPRYPASFRRVSSVVTTRVLSSGNFFSLTITNRAMDARSPGGVVRSRLLRRGSHLDQRGGVDIQGVRHVSGLPTSGVCPARRPARRRCRRGNAGARPEARQRQRQRQEHCTGGGDGQDAQGHVDPPSGLGAVGLMSMFGTVTAPGSEGHPIAVRS